MRHNPDKSNDSDAKMLAELCRVGLIPPVWLAWLRDASELSEDASFVVRTHLLELDHPAAQCGQVEERLERRTCADPIVRRLRGIKGVGPVTAWTMRALIGRFDRFINGKQLSRFGAVTPRNASSGQRRGRGHRQPVDAVALPPAQGGSGHVDRTDDGSGGTSRVCVGVLGCHLGSAAAHARISERAADATPRMTPIWAG